MNRLIFIFKTGYKVPISKSKPNSVIEDITHEFWGKVLSQV